MEVYLGNLPEQVTDNSLGKLLKPFMNALGITDWSCSSKPSKTKQKIGLVLFLYEEDANRFLKRYEKKQIAPASETKDGQVSSSKPSKKPRDKANFWLLNTPIYVAKSKNPPNSFHIKTLIHRLEEQAKQRNLNQQTAPPAANEIITFSAIDLACGHNSFRNNRQALTFVEQYRMASIGHAKFTKRMLLLKYNNGVRVEVSYASIYEMIHSSSPCTFVLVLSEPPRFLQASTEIEDAFAGLAVRNQPSPQKQHIRCPGFPDATDHSDYAGKCLVYQLTIVEPDFDRKMMALEKKNLFSIAHFNIAHDQTPSPKILDYGTSWTAFYDHLTRMGQNNIIPFRILFLMQSLVWNNFLHPRTAHELVMKVETLFREARRGRSPDPISEQAIKNLRDGPRDSIPFPTHDVSPHLLDPQELTNYLVEVETRIRRESFERDTLFGRDVSKHYTYILKAVVTPTRITLHGPELEPYNRILRKYPNHTDYFMRVQFCDEDGSDLFFNPKVSYERIFDRYKSVLNGGIQVAGRVYQFLGFSHSSLRSHSTWFMAPFVDDNGQMHLYQHIIKSLGDFARIQIPAKCAARIGQAFSETPSFISIVNSRISWYRINDVKRNDNGVERVFSDGVGTISHEALQQIWPYLTRGSLIPTCLQIRWGGVKGMLSLDSRLQGRTMCIRAESMEKFPSKDTENLEICDAASRPLKLMLNRQLIKIMEDLEVDPHFFLRLQEMELDRLRAVTADSYNTGTFLHLQGIGLNLFLPSFIKSLEKYGIDYRRDEFLRTVVEATVLRELRLLKHKARIPVHKGATLFGVMDETGFLQEGEVYVCYDSYKRPGRGSIDNSLRDGRVLVTRSPALHPGDIQLARMRTPPAGHPLRDLRNCIAFSQFGKRDLPSKLSGGDLDGDLYNVIWDRDAMPKRIFSPAEYPRVTPQPLGREVTREDMANWFVDFMKSDVLGMIATRHLILSDQDPNGTVGADCLTLAALHSTAVDFSKSGIPVNPRDIPKAPKYRPDFLAPAPPAHLHDRHLIDFLVRDTTAYEEDEDLPGPKHEFYPSDKILGVLYRNVDEKRIWDDDISRVVSTSGPSVWDQFVGLMHRKIHDYTQGRVSWKTRMAEAKRLRDVYEDTVLTAMSQYSDSHAKPLTEVEVFCGHILNVTGSQTRRQKENSKRLKADFDRLSEWLVLQMRRKFKQTDQDGNGDPDSGTGGGFNDHLDRLLAPNKAALELSYACLIVGLKNDRDTDNEYRVPMQSFKVIAASVLLRELTDLANLVKGGRMIAPVGAEGSGGGFVGVSAGPAPTYAYNGFDVDVGQYPNYGFSEYI